MSDQISVEASPWLVDSELVARELGTDASSGLTSAEATSRLGTVGPNRLKSKPRVPAWRKLLAQFANPLVYLLLVAIAISLTSWIIEGAEGVPFETIVIGAIVVGNALLGFTQEAKAEEAVAALQRMTTPISTVVRDGTEVRVPSETVVPGDVLILSEGDAIGADGRLVEAASLTVAEASLTGESEPVLKETPTLEGSVPLGDRTNMVFGGTAVTRGRGRAIVTTTGMSTEIGRIADLLEQTEDEPTPLQREIDHVAKVLGTAVLVIAAVVVVAILLASDIEGPSEVVDVLLVGVALAVAAVPEGLPAVLTVVLALGVQRMASQNAIVKGLSSVETLGSTSVICTDKTGTLTRNEMTIERVVTHSGEVTVTGTGYRPEGELLAGGVAPKGALLEELRLVVSGGSLANDATLQIADGEWLITGDPTEAAFLVAERKGGFTSERDGRFQRVGELPFTAERKLMSTLQAETAETGGMVGIVTKGAPDVLLTRCTHERVGTDVVPLTTERSREILAAVDQLADQAFRTLGVAYRLLEQPPGEVGEHLEQGMVFAGVAGIIDPSRPEAGAAVEEAHRAGIRVVMITGDHPRTAGRIADDLGITGPGTSVVTGAELDQLDEVALRRVALDSSVYARVAPEHKLLIVDALRGDGSVVAMTGDGVNDAPALKRADIGIAMGITGTEVAKEAADMILTDDNFATIVGAVREGRGIFSNIRKFLRYLLSSNIGEVLTMLLGVIFAGVIGLDGVAGALAVPLLAPQILWINLLTDSAPALALGVDPAPDDVMRRSPRGLKDRVIDAEMMKGVLFVGLVMAVATLFTLDAGLIGGLIEGQHGITEARTMAFTTLVLAQLFNCLNARSDRESVFRHLFTNRALWAAIAVSLVLQIAVVYVPFLNAAFDTSPLTGPEWLFCAAMASSVLWASEIWKLAKRHRPARQEVRLEKIDRKR